jgi:acetyltransferase
METAPSTAGRPVRPDDDELFRDFAKGVSEEDARLRFFAPKKELSDADLARLVHLDYERAMAFVASEESRGRMVGVVRLHADPNRESREFAITVRSDFKGHGLGWMLMQFDNRICADHGANTVGKQDGAPSSHSQYELFIGATTCR